MRAASSITGQGVSSRSSHSWATGRMTSSAKSWTHFWIWSWSSSRSTEKSAIAASSDGSYWSVTLPVRTSRPASVPAGGTGGHSTEPGCADGGATRSRPRGSGAGPGSGRCALAEVTVHQGVHPVRHLALDRLAPLGADPAVRDRLVDGLVDPGDHRVDHGLHVDAVRGGDLGDALAALEGVAQLDAGDADGVGDDAAEHPAGPEVRVTGLLRRRVLGRGRAAVGRERHPGGASRHRAREGDRGDQLLGAVLDVHVVGLLFP